MKVILLIIFLLSYLDITSSTIPVWKFSGLANSLFADSSSPAVLITFSDSTYTFKRTFSKDGDSLNIKNQLYINGNPKDVEFEGIGGVFYDVQDLSTVICPKGNFLPHQSNGEPYNLNNNFRTCYNNKKWDLKCQTHSSGYFLSFYFNNCYKSLYGYSPSKKEWDGGNELREELYDVKVKESTTGENGFYPILFLAKVGQNINLIGARETLKNWNGESIHRDSETLRVVLKIKTNSACYFEDNSEIFYCLTYNENSFSIVYSKDSISDYLDSSKINSVEISSTEDLTFNFVDKVEILEMNFISKTQNIYYSVKNIVNGKIYHGLMDFKTQKILFNIDEPIVKFDPLSNYEMLVTTTNSAFKICLYKYNSECVASCPSDTRLVYDAINGNECISDSITPVCSSNIKLMPDDICIESCDTNIYVLDNGICQLCKDHDSSKPYRIINTPDCLPDKPEGTEDFNEKLGLLTCSKGYQLDTEINSCVTHCYPTCKTCSDYSEDESDQKCLTCEKGEPNNGTCEVSKPTTIVTEKPTTIVTEKPTTVVTEKPTTIVTEKPTTIITEKPSETNLITDEVDESCSLEKCKKCNVESLKFNLCLSCKEELGYLTVNYTTYQPGFVDCRQKTDPLLDKFFYNETRKEYRPCYKTCKKCSKGGNGEAHNCLECEQGYMFRPGDNPHNNCVVYSEFYYIDSYNQYKSMDILQCPEEAKYLVKDKNYCISDCKKEKKYKFLYGGNCISSCPQETKNVDFICQEDPNKPTLTKHRINIMPDEDNYLKVVKPLAKAYVNEYSYTKNHIALYENEKVNIILYEDGQNLEDISLDMPKVDFQNCATKINNNFNLENNALTSVIEKKDKNKNHQETEYYFFHPVSGEQLEVDNLCENETIIIKENLTSFLDENTTTFKLQMSLVEQGINIFDLNDGFYKDIRYDFDNPGKRDIALRDRVREAYPNATLCEEGCRNEGIDLGDMTARCDCSFRSFSQNSIVKENALLDNLVGEVFDFIDDSNILVVKCYKYIIKYFTRSIGGIITIIVISLNIIFSFILFCCQFNSIKKYILKVTKGFLKFLQIFNNKIEVNPPKKIKNEKNKNNFNEKRRKSNRASTKLGIKPEGDILKTKNKDEKYAKINVTEYQTTIDNTMEEEKKIKDFYKEYLETPPDEMEFDDAIKKDERTFCQYFYDNLKEKQIIANTFFASDEIKKRSIKLILFNLNLVLYFVINGLFFSEVYISELYNIKDEDEHFFSFIPRSIDRMIYATIVSVVVGFLVDCFFIEERKIVGIFKREQPDQKSIKVCIKLVKETKKRYIGFYCFGIYSSFMCIILFIML